MKILVTGGAGFIGSTTCELLEANRHSVLVVDNFSTSNASNLKNFRGHVSLCDITDVKLLERAFHDFQPDAVIHLAAQSAISTSWSDPEKDISVNSIGTLNLLRLSKEYKVKRFVFASTSAVYDETQKPVSETWWCEPKTPYGISKLAAELYIRAMFKNHVILRYGNVYGPRQVSIGENQVVARAIAHFVRGDEFKVVGDGNQKRDFVFVEDIAFANFFAVSEINPVVGVYNAASGKSRSVNDALSVIEDIYGVRGYKWEHTNTRDPRGNVSINTRKIRSELGWSALLTLEAGLRKTSEWWNEKSKVVV